MPDAASLMRTSPSLGGSSSIGSTLHGLTLPQDSCFGFHGASPGHDDATVVHATGHRLRRVGRGGGERPQYALWVGPLEIAPGDARAEDVGALVQRHLDFARAHTPAELVFAVGVGDLADDPGVTLLCGRRDGRLLAIGALRELDPGQGELKSMHTAAEVRGRGIGRAMLAQLVALARQRGYRRVSLETGRSEAFAPARALYASAGFAECGTFGDYPEGGQSFFMTTVLD